MASMTKVFNTFVRYLFDHCQYEKLNFLKASSFLHTSASFCGKDKFIKMGYDVNKYTMKPMPLPKTGGRGPNGRIWTYRIGGGHKQRYRMIDFKRIGPADGTPLMERVMQVRYDPCRTADIAIVAGGEHKRYIVATQNMKVGDVIKTSSHIPKMTVRAEEGDAYPVGALPVGSLVNCVEKYPGEGGEIARAAGVCGQLVRKIGDRCIIKMPSKREMNVSRTCMATVGRVSNVEHHKEHIGSAVRARWFGVRPKSGWWHRKTGYHGRKIRPIKPAKNYVTPPSRINAVYKLTE